MIIKRYKPSLLQGHPKARSIVLVGIALLTMSSISSVQAGYQSAAVKRGNKITFALKPATPLREGDSAALGFTSALTPNDPLVNAPVPMPDLIAPDQYGVLATPPATPQGTPFVMPTVSNPGQAAAPYVFASRNPTDSLRAAICLTTAIYYEAVSESEDGQRAVAQTILNRVRHPSWPNTVCGVVYQGSDGPVCQFSYACDGAMARRPSITGWIRASRIAREALAGYVYAPAGLSTFYHTPQVNPSWNKRLNVAHVIGNHIFYRMPGVNGTLTAFTDHYAGGEPLPGPMAKKYSPSAAAALAAARAKQMAVPMPAAAAPVPMPQISAAPVPMPVQQPTYQGQPAPYLPKVNVEADGRYVQGAVPESDVLPAYRDSGSWIKR
jgi:Cell Wall Hydrolase